MQVAGIVAEYNPFHTGHAYHIRKTRAMGASHVAVAMSTSFVQRGEMAAFDLFTRAKAALAQGADVVAALPAVYSMSGAERFCRAGIETLSLLGCDIVSFGCQTEPEQLTALKEQCEQAVNSEQFASYLARGMHFARARAQAVDDLFGTGQLLSDANTALGLGYLTANDALPHPMRPMVIARAGVSHDASVPHAGYASASYLRTKSDGWERYLPEAEPFLLAEQEGRTPHGLLTDRMLTGLLKCRTLSDWERAAGVREGLHHTLFAAAQKAMSAEELLIACKSKRYPHSALRRSIWSAALGITEDLQVRAVSGVWIITANERGYELLAHARTRRRERADNRPVTPKFADFAKTCPELAAVEKRAADLYALCTPSGTPVNLYR